MEKENTNNFDINENIGISINDKLRSLISISKYINSNIELEKLLNIIIKTSRDLVDSEESSLMLLDKNNDRLIFYSVSGSNESFINQFSFPASQGIAGQVIKSGESILIDDAQNDPRHFNKIDKELNFITRNIIAVPMKQGGKTVGLIEVINAKNRTKFNQNDLELLQYLADLSALAIINRELNQNVREKVEELQALYELSTASAFAKTVGELFNNAIKILNQIFKVKSCVIINKTTDLNTVYKAKDYDLYFDAQKILLDNDYDEMELISHKNMDYKNICSIAIPLVAQGEIIGVLAIGDLSKSGQFGELELRLLSTIANQISDACENIRLREEEEEKKRIEKEVDIMRNLQQGIIPKEFPDFKLMEITGYNLPALEVGGDFYDVFKLSDKKVGFVIADVSGKGASAGLFMALSRSIVKVFAYNNSSPSEVLFKSNNVIIEDSKNGMFVTLFYAMVDMEKKKLKYSNGGHNRQILYSKKDNKCKYLYLKGRPMGVIDDSSYLEDEIDIGNGDILFLYTDGINESTNEKYQEFGDDKLLEIIKENHDRSVSEIKNKILEELSNFVGEAKQGDDITMLMMKLVDDEEENEITINTTTETKNVGYIVDKVEAFLHKQNIREDIIEDIMIVIDEAVTNVIMYSYEDKYNTENKIICKIIHDKEKNNQIEVIIKDFGEHSPNVNGISKKPEFDINGNRLGGFGLYIMNNFMDELKFERIEEKSENILYMRKYL